MMRTFVIPLIIIIVFLFGAATLMATAPVLEPAAQTPVPTTVRVREVQPESVQLKVDIGGPSEYRVKWILQGPLVGGIDAGQLSDDGLYTAPASMPTGPVRIVTQISTGEWNLPVAAASVPVQIIPEGMPKPTFGRPPAPPPFPFQAGEAGTGTPPAPPAPPANFR